jgi:hypothetical protein
LDSQIFSSSQRSISAIQNPQFVQSSRGLAAANLVGQNRAIETGHQVAHAGIGSRDGVHIDFDQIA